MKFEDKKMLKCIKGNLQKNIEKNHIPYGVVGIQCIRDRILELPELPLEQRMSIEPPNIVYN